MSWYCYRRSEILRSKPKHGVRWTYVHPNTTGAPIKGSMFLNMAFYNIWIHITQYYTYQRVDKHAKRMHENDLFTRKNEFLSRYINDLRILSRNTDSVHIYCVYIRVMLLWHGTMVWRRNGDNSRTYTENWWLLWSCCGYVVCESWLMICEWK